MCNNDIIVIGIEKTGIELVKDLSKIYNDKIDYLTLEDNCDFLYKIQNKKAVIIAGEISDATTYKNFISIVNETNKNNIFSMAFISGKAMDNEKLNFLSEKCLAFYNYSYDDIHVIISNIIGLTIYPGYIGLDLYDIINTLNGKTSGFIYVTSGYSVIECVNKAAKFIINHVKDYCGMVVTLEADYKSFSLLEVNDMINQFKTLIPNYKKIDSLYGTQSLRTDKNKYRLCITLGI